MPLPIRCLLCAIAFLSLASCASGYTKNTKQILAQSTAPLEKLRADVSANPKDAEALLALAAHHLNDRNPAEALTLAQNAVGIAPKFAPAHLFVAAALNGSGMKARTAERIKSPRPARTSTQWFADADKEFEKALRLDDTDASAWVVWGAALYDRSAGNILMWPTADPLPIIEKYRKALALEPGNLEASRQSSYVLYTYASVISWHRKLVANAKRSNRRRPRLPKWMPKDMQGVANTYLQEGIKNLRSALEAHPKDQNLHFLKGRFLIGLNRYDEGVAQFKYVMLSFPGSHASGQACAAWKELIRQLKKTENSAAALQRVERELADYMTNQKASGGGRRSCRY